MKLSYPVDIGAYKSKAAPLALNECLNLYPSNPQTSGAASRGGLFSLPGTKDVQFADTNGYQGQHVFQGELYVASNSEFIKIDADGVSTVLGTFATSTPQAPVIMDDNGETICIVIPARNQSYFYDTTNGLVRITDTVFQDREAESGGVGSVTFVDGYFAFSTEESVFISSLVTVNRGQNFDALDIEKPFLRDKALRVATVKGELYVFGEDQIKTYANVGGADFPFVQIGGATIDKGLVDRFGLVIFDNSFTFLGGGKNERVAVWRGLGGGAVTKISTDYIDAEWYDYKPFEVPGGISAPAISYGFMFEGRPFIGFSLYGYKTFLYDLVTSASQGRHVWIEASDQPEGSPARTFGYGIVEAYQKLFYVTTTQISEFTADSTKIENAFTTANRSMVFSGSYLQAQSDPLIINRLELVAETGVGADREINPNETDPTVLLELSDDGGRTFKSAGERPLGRIGDYGRRVVWNRLNYAPTSRIFKFSTSANVPIRFVRIDIDAQKGYRNA